jgi:hypothetical protein
MLKDDRDFKYISSDLFYISNKHKYYSLNIDYINKKFQGSK